MSYWCWIYRVACGTLAVVFLIGVSCIFYPRIEESRELQVQYNENARNLERMEEQLLHLREQQQNFHSDPKFVEDLARTQLGWAKEGEIIFRVTASSDEPNPAAR